MFSAKISLDKSQSIEVLMQSLSEIEKSQSTTLEYNEICNDDEFWRKTLIKYYPKESGLISQYELDQYTLENPKTRGQPFNLQSVYERFKWCFKQDFYIHSKYNGKTEFISKIKSPDLWWICQLQYLRLRENNLLAVKSLRQRYKNIFDSKLANNVVRLVDGIKPLYIACVNGQIDAVKWLIANNASIESGQINTESLHLGCIPTINPLYAACAKNNLEMVQFLIENKASVEAQCYSKGSSYSALYAACRNGNAEIVKILLKEGARVDSGYSGSNDRDYESPLYVACRKGHVEVVRLLLENGADVNWGSGKAIDHRHIRRTTPLEYVKQHESSSQNTKVKKLLDQYISKEKIKDEFRAILKEKNCLNAVPLIIAQELFKWYAEQVFFSKHSFHYQNISNNIISKLQQIHEKDFTLELFMQILDEAFTAQANADRKSWFNFWKTPANHKMIKEDGHFKTMEDFIKTNIMQYQPAQLKQMG